jgi:hypothetical protein
LSAQFLSDCVQFFLLGFIDSQCGERITPASLFASTLLTTALATLTRSAEPFTTALATIKLRSHFFLVNFAILIFVQCCKGFGGILQFIGSQCAVFIFVNCFHDRVGRAETSATTKSTLPSAIFTWASAGATFIWASAGATFTWASTGPTFTWASTGATFTWASTGPTFTWASAGPTRSVALLAAEKFLHLFAAGTLVFIKLAILVLVELFKKQFTNVLLLSL